MQDAELALSTLYN